MTVSIVSGHRRIAPYGMAGGQAGLVGQNALQRANGSYEVLAGISQVHVEVGDILSITTPGGGGFADYLNTDQAWWAAYLKKCYFALDYCYFNTCIDRNSYAFLSDR